MTPSLRKILVSACALTLLGGCSGAKEQLGLTRNAPDEFAVIKRAPLEMPPEFTLRPPEPGAPRPQEQAVIDQAAEAVLGTKGAEKKKADSKKAPTKAENALLQEANAQSNPDIRQIVDDEATKTAEKDQPVVKKLLNIGKEQLPPAKVVDPNAEAARIKKNAQEGKPVTEGATPAIDD